MSFKIVDKFIWADKYVSDDSRDDEDDEHETAMKAIQSFDYKALLVNEWDDMPEPLLFD